MRNILVTKSHAISIILSEETFLPDPAATEMYEIANDEDAHFFYLIYSFVVVDYYTEVL